MSPDLKKIQDALRARAESLTAFAAHVYATEIREDTLKGVPVIEVIADQFRLLADDLGR